jgi:hypothetical protein
MKLRPLLIGIAVAALRVQAASAQTPTALSTYFPTLAWDAAKSGPLIVIDAEHVTANGPASLRDFGRKLVPLGTLSAIVPITMVIIDERGRRQQRDSVRL